MHFIANSENKQFTTAHLLSVQVLIRLQELMTRNRFETISTFLHVVTTRDEARYRDHPLRKVLPLHNHMKQRCLELYQPLPQLSIDERMVKSKARSHFRQYVRNKPTKWGFKYWVISDPTGYTLDFDLYCGKHRAQPLSSNGLTFDVVMELVKPYHFQGYQVFMDNFYTSPTLVQELLLVGIRSTGTLTTSRRGVPPDVVQMKAALKHSSVARGTGYYIREPTSPIVYVCWRDRECVTLISTAHPGHQEGTAKRRSKDSTGQCVTLDVPLPSVVKQYNTFMGGVDKSDQLISYHRMTRQTKRYWKTIFYHLFEVAVTNAFILFKLSRIADGKKFPTESRF